MDGETKTSMLTGYTNRLTARPGEALSFMVSSPSGAYHAQLYRIFQGDRDPAGPGEKLLPIDVSLNGSYEGGEQQIRPGSYIEIAASNHLALHGDFTVFLWVFPTLQNGREQVLLSREDDAGRGYRLGLDSSGRTFFQSGERRVTACHQLETGRWQWIGVSYLASTYGLTIHSGRHFKDPTLETVAPTTLQLVVQSPSMDVALFLAGRGQAGYAQDSFNGRIASPVVYGRCLPNHEIDALALIGDHSEFVSIADCLAAWDFNIGHEGTLIHDASANALHGTTRQRPMRAITGPHWTGAIDDFRFDRNGYSAIHFHRDGLTDANWNESFSFTVPENLTSGIYIVRITAGDEYDDIPFVVSPPLGQRQADVALLVPTFTYLAYGNYPSRGIDGIKCLYDLYEDSTGVPHASGLHPIPTIRPHRGFVLTTEGIPFARHLSADLYFLDWANERDLAIDVITDHDLHEFGLDLLKPYKGVFTGSHPEYVSEQMLNALERYRDTGGSLAYMGGNGFYWVTSVAPGGSFIEVRRPNGSRNWTSRPGEGHNALTGEIAGLWRLRGRPPQQLVGVGFTAQGYDANDHAGPPRPHNQVADRAVPIARELFEGVPEGIRIGDFRTLGIGIGAAGDEIDRLDYALGSPSHATLLARAEGFAPMYQPVIEDLRESNQLALPPPYRSVRSDIVAFETRTGGFVFSVGTMQWFSALYHDDYKNSVSQITENVFRKMLGGAPPTRG
ncbi:MULTISPECIES: N,N-dimethylformamidase beta subunit family domain-containing protein [unclassified Mesorhizobium]|uniref:N,N-dimethylformamidase beta subunit family domain-containing protein n=1 Tax=unclassified Mesorhizobium TaxID=325217 RepID=UPI00241568E8|nr:MULTISPECIES: N,N-dimethylformamidase beta subunit family domain-containing protein [unclassified Mesorhizobium]MDG4890098.1 hypothetical protein [Mesorhizobium sp. WSM4887]MDG4904240.1 hypothetical protein [Mesorhizobium sp. WSM4962]MDG4909267.1 hypothetical protein [Mesorhizobium sp. WSM4898]MDG4921891.1 hypothetical protein [Mesorhizobium sp. WSM4989]